MAKILLISHCLGCTGAPASLLRHATYFKEAGHDVDIWSLGSGSLSEEYQKDGFTPKFITPLDCLKIKKHSYDLIVCNTTGTHKCVQIIKKKKIPLVWFIRETKLVNENIANSKKFADCFSTYYNLYTVSEYAANVTKKYNPNVRVISNSVQDKFKSFTDIGDNLRFGYIGSIIHVKGVEVLLKAFSNLLDNGKNVSLKIAGHIDDNAKELYRTYSKYSQIEWLGEVRDAQKENFFDGIDVLVVPSLDEPFGLTLLEGCMKGKIVITTDKVGSNHFVVNNKSGFIVEAGNEDAIYIAIEEILQKKKDELSAMQSLSREQYLKYGRPQREKEEVLKMLADNMNNIPPYKVDAEYICLSLKSMLKNMFYERRENCKRYFIFGIPVFSVKKDGKNKEIKIFGIKISCKK